MKRLLVFIVVLLACAIVHADDGFAVRGCRVTPASGRFTYTWNGPDTEAEFGYLGQMSASGIHITLKQGTHEFVTTGMRRGRVTAYIHLKNRTYEATVTLHTHPCNHEPDDSSTGRPDGGARNITIDNPPCDVCQWQIMDAYGHWSDVATTNTQVEGDRRFVRLVLGEDNTDTDASHYRVR